MKPTIHIKRGMLSKTVMLHHNMAAMVKAMQQIGLEHLLHPPYSHDLMLCNYHVFTPFKRL